MICFQSQNLDVVKLQMMKYRIRLKCILLLILCGKDTARIANYAAMVRKIYAEIMQLILKIVQQYYVEFHVF